MKQVAKDRLAAAVKAGRLTEAQADEIRERIDSSDCAPIGPHGSPSAVAAVVPVDAVTAREVRDSARRAT